MTSQKQGHLGIPYENQWFSCAVWSFIMELSFLWCLDDLLFKKAFQLKIFLKKVKVAQSCPTLCNPLDCSSADSSVRGISQARILEWVAYPFCSRSSRPRNWTGVSCVAGGFFTNWAIGEAQNLSRRCICAFGFQLCSFILWVFCEECLWPEAKGMAELHT